MGNRVIRVYAKTKAAVILRTWRHDMQTVGTQLRRWMQFIKILAKVTSLFRNLDALPAAIVSDTFDVTKKSKSWIEDRASRVSLFMQAWMQSGSMASEIFHLPSGSRDLPFSDFIRENIADLMQNNVDPLAQCRIGAKSLSIAATLDKCVTRLSGMQNLALSCMPSLVLGGQATTAELVPTSTDCGPSCADWIAWWWPSAGGPTRPSWPRWPPIPWEPIESCA